MRVLFHSDAFALKAEYGLGRYAEELWKSILHNTQDIELIPFALKGSSRRADPLDSSQVINVYGPKMDYRIVIMAWTIFGLPRYTSLFAKSDVIHTVELDYPLPVVNKPWITTVHDIGPLTHGEYFSKSRPAIRKKGLEIAAKRADIIIAVSQATADEIQNYLQQDLGSRLKVVHEGVDESFFVNKSLSFPDDLLSLPKNTPYFLWTGSMNPRKNISNVLRAFRIVADKIPHHLVLAGGLGWDTDALINNINLDKYSDRIHRPGYVSNDQLKVLYQGADAFIYTSIMEGFGLPILEAMASGCPVITSNISSMPEVAGDVGLLVNPFDAEDISASMLSIASPSLRTALSKQGVEHARKFSWQKCARQMGDIYKQFS